MSGEIYNIKQYNRRWANLFLFVIYAINNGAHWAQYSVITDSIITYYNIPHAYVEWTSGMFNLSYVLLVVPGLYAMSKIKMRYIMIMASSLSTLGAWMKVFSVVPDRFILAFIGQIIISASYTFTFGGSARLIAAWFGVHESSRASALSLFGDQCGGAVSFIIPVIMVQKSLDPSNITMWEDSLRRMHIACASMSTLFFVLIVFLFKDKPKNPPSMVQALKKGEKSETFAQALPKMVKNKAFLMLLFWYSIVGALLNTIGAVIGELISINFPDSSEEAGTIGFLLSAFGMFSSPIFGYIMDKTHRFREVGIVLASGSFISFALFTLVLKMNNILFVYLSAIVLGIFITSTYVNGIPIGIEILHPISEDQCSAMMVFIMQLFSTILLVIYGPLLRKYGDINANLLFCILTFTGLVVCFFTPVKLNRQEAEQKTNAKELKEFLPNSIPQIVKH